MRGRTAAFSVKATGISFPPCIGVTVLTVAVRVALQAPASLWRTLRQSRPTGSTRSPCSAARGSAHPAFLSYLAYRLLFLLAVRGIGARALGRLANCGSSWLHRAAGHSVGPFPSGQHGPGRAQRLCGWGRFRFHLGQLLGQTRKEECQDSMVTFKEIQQQS